MSEADGRVALAWRVLPVLFALLLLGNVGALVLLGSLGGRARGERVELLLSGPCLGPARAHLQARVESLGLGSPEWVDEPRGLVLRATLPGLPDDRSAIPALLSAPGELAVLSEGQVVATRADLASAHLELDESGMPVNTLVFHPEPGERLARLVEERPQGELVFLLDGEEIARRPNSVKVTEHKLRIYPGEGETRDRMKRATDRSIVLGNGPLPCRLRAEVQSPAE